MVPVCDAREVPLSRLLTDRGTEYCGSPDTQEYERYWAVENLAQTRTQGKSPQTKGLGERLPKPLRNEVYRRTVRKKLYPTLPDLQRELDSGRIEDHEARGPQGRWC